MHNVVATASRDGCVSLVDVRDMVLLASLCGIVAQEHLLSVNPQAAAVRLKRSARSPWPLRGCPLLPSSSVLAFGARSRHLCVLHSRGLSCSAWRGVRSHGLRVCFARVSSPTCPLRRVYVTVAFFWLRVAVYEQDEVRVEMSMHTWFWG